MFLTYFVLKEEQGGLEGGWITTNRTRTARQRASREEHGKKLLGRSFKPVICVEISFELLN